MQSDGWWWKANQVAAALLRRSDREMEPPSICLIGAINWWNRLKDGEMGELSLSFCDFHTSLTPSLSLSPYLQLSLFKASLLPLIIPPSLLPPAWCEGEGRKMYVRSTLLNRQSDNGLSYFWNKQWYCASERQGWWLDQRERRVGEK